MGCKPEERPIPKEDGKKAPKTLNKFDETIHSVIESIESIEDILRITPEDLKPPEEKAPEKEEAQEKEKQAFSPVFSPLGTNEKKQQEKQSKVLEKWESAKKDTEALHELWNQYEPQALKDGADNEKIEEMEESLNDLTSYIEEKERDPALFQANNVVLSLSKFMELYDGNPNGLLGKIEYMARQSYMNGKDENWQSAQEKVKEKDALVSALRQKTDIKEEQKKLIERLIFSLDDLEKIIIKENLPLLKIKRDIVIKNVETLKKELE